MARRPNFGFEKRQKEIERQKKKEIKAEKKRLRKAEAADDGKTPTAGGDDAADGEEPSSDAVGGARP